MDDGIRIFDKLKIQLKRKKRKTNFSWFKGWIKEFSINIRKKEFWFKFTKKW